MSYSRDITLTSAFAEYGAVLRNRLYDYSAIAKDGSVVVSCWEHLIKRLGVGMWRYEIVDLTEWTGNGVDLLKQHLRYAVSEDKPVRLVLAIPKGETKPNVAATCGRETPKTISVRKDFIGRVVTFDDHGFIIDFQRDVPPANRSL